jgi:hypothetical protein
MNLLETVPWAKVAAHLHDRIENATGFEGAVIGAALGAATTLATAASMSRKPSATAVLAAAAVGMAYGVTDKKSLKLTE